MKKLKPKLVAIVILALFTLFFSNNFGLIDIEKTAIITAVAIDIEDGEYVVTTQVAVPEATDVNSENKKAHLTGKGSTVAKALKNVGDISGWYPHLSFCNLIILGKGFYGENVIRVLDYFTKTLRVQDSAVVVFSEEKAGDIISKSSPLDNISSFALQKILFKTLGFDKDVSTVDIRSFVIGYYSKTKSSYMPIIKEVEVPENGESQSSSDGGGGESSNEKKVLFNARNTALFYEGVYVSDLSEDLTLSFCLLSDKFDGTVISADNLSLENATDTHNYLITVVKAKPKVSLEVENGIIYYKADIDLYCKISDQNAEYSDSTFAKNTPLPREISEFLSNKFTTDINGLIDKIKETGCDFLEIKEKLYRFKNKEYSLYKDDYLDRLECKVKINASGQK